MIVSNGKRGPKVMPPPPKPDDPAPVAKKIVWLYKVVDLYALENDRLQLVLDRYGADGWELVGYPSTWARVVFRKAKE
jgi:hypothetical protein